MVAILGRPSDQRRPNSLSYSSSRPFGSRRWGLGAQQKHRLIGFAPRSSEPMEAMKRPLCGGEVPTAAVGWPARAAIRSFEFWQGRGQNRPARSASLFEARRASGGLQLLVPDGCLVHRSGFAPLNTAPCRAGSPGSAAVLRPTSWPKLVEMPAGLADALFGYLGYMPA